MPPLDVEKGSRSRIASSPLSSSSSSAAALVVPVPVPCVLDVTQGSPLCHVGHAAANLSLSEGDLIRIHHPYHSANFEVSSCCIGVVGRNTSTTSITLNRPYDHTPIIEREDSAKRFEDALERLHCPYNRKNENGIGSDGDDENDDGFVRTTSTAIPTNCNITGSRGSKRWLLDVAATDNTSAPPATPVNITLMGTRVWRLVAVNSDKRSPWRRQYDDGDAPSDLTFDLKMPAEAEAEGRMITLFRIPLKQSTIMSMCRDVPYDPERSIHQQRVQYFDQVAVEFVVRETYRAVCDWHPACSTIDNVKWAKLSRKMGFLVSVRNTSHEVDMAFLRRCQDRKLDLDRFRAILEDVAWMQHPRLELRAALKKLLWNTVVMLPHVNERVWSEAKALAISVEARRNCAQMRLAATFRRIKHRARYCKMVAAVTCIAKCARMRIQVVRRLRRLEDMERQRLRRLRERSAIQCQKIWRGHFCQVSYQRRRAQILKRERQKSAELRRKLKVERAQREASIICRFARSVQGHQAVVTMSLHGAANSSHLLMRVYLPVVQKTFDFCFPEETLQLYIQQQMLHREESMSMSWREMLKPELLKGLADRLIVRRVNGLPIVIFSKRNLAEKGQLISKKLIQGDDNGGIYLLSIYKSTVDFTFCLYDPATCGRLRTSLSHAALHKWLSDEARLVHVEGSRSHCPRCRCLPSLALLLPGRQDDLVEWLSTRLSVKTSPDTGHRRVLFQFDADREKAERLACKIQSVVRKLAARARARTIIREQFEKIFDRDSGAYYYVNSKTGACQWTKPVLLGDDELDIPKDEWRQIECTPSRPGEPSAYYHNPGTGQLSWMSEEQAARMLQRRVRERQAADITGPKLDFATVASAVKFINDAEKAFAEQPDRLSHKVNYAMVCHCLKFDFDQAKQQYEEAIQRCPSHPVIGRAHAILLLATCVPCESDAKRNHVVEKALALFREAEIGDPTARMFRLAIQNCFLWAVVVHPRNPLALLNSALLHQHVLKDPRRADKLYRRALAIDMNGPNAAIVRQNYEMFQS
mmetsp:Transcript_21311/g.61139  ORF Transcript_21311/g.61139 Transcript_21311/m.61139 type:complete len:1040 (-) Transcript_21311:220-3339(-)